MKDERILIVDDEESILKALNRTLNFYGYTPLVTTNPYQAIEIINEGNIDILICDQRMPEMMGNNVLQHARNISPNSIRILMTGYSDMESTIAAINDGQIFRYIPKPWKEEELIRLLEEAAEFRQELSKKEYILSSLLTEKEDWKRTRDRLALSLDNNIKGAIKALSKIIMVKDIELFEHGQRVQALALNIAVKTGLTEEQINNLATATLFHDIGKIAIKDMILYKNGPLDEVDFDTMKQHPIYSMEIIKELGFLDAVADIILQHHEKIDGNGYPYRLIDNEILQEAKILAIADVYDALISDRVYHKGLKPDEALHIMRKGSGTHFSIPLFETFQESLRLE